MAEIMTREEVRRKILRQAYGQLGLVERMFDDEDCFDHDEHMQVFDALQEVEKVLDDLGGVRPGSEGWVPLMEELLDDFPPVEGTA